MELDQINEAELLGFPTPDPTGIIPLLGVQTHQDLELIILQAESLKSLNSDILISCIKNITGIMTEVTKNLKLILSQLVKANADLSPMDELLKHLLSKRSSFNHTTLTMTILRFGML